MKRLVLLFLLATTARAGAEPPILVENKACAASYDAYVASFERERRGIVAEIEADLATATGPRRENLIKGRDEAKAGKPIAQDEFDGVFAPSSPLTCRRLVYRSEGFKVVAYAVGPRAPGKHPVLFHLRGGNGDFGRVSEWTLVRHFAFYARAGYLVIAPQYRGVDGGEGKDEFGGGELADVLALPAVARALPDADPDRLFLYGVSRGGMEAYMALRRGLAVRAAVVHAGMADADQTIAGRPEMEDVFKQRVPDYAANKAAALRARSAVRWAEELTTPILILQGTADWRVDPSHVLAVAARMVAAKREVSLILFAGDDHGLSKNRDEARRQTLRWYAAHGGLAAP